jgi:hypothetical protein
MSPDGGNSGHGRGERPTLTVWSANPDAFCRFVTTAASPVRALLTATGEVRVYGDLDLAARLLSQLAPV